MKIKSSLVTLKEMVDERFFFNIPIYQRLYVWKEEQVNNLLEDIKTAFIDEKEIFYLGSTLIVENESFNNGKLYDLIDGQQRLTTLWMIAMVFKGDMENFIKTEMDNKEIYRVSFSIRKDINDFFENYINGFDSNIRNSNIVNALSLIEKHKNEFEVSNNIKPEKISEFIYNKVKLVLTEVHRDTDLNKLFEVINNRGVQLQHHEILKAKLLSKLNSKNRIKYGHLWDACSYMNNYIERNIQNITDSQFHQLFDENNDNSINEKLSDPKMILDVFDIQNKHNDEVLSLSCILKNEETYASKEDTDNKKAVESEEDNIKVRSIITFPMLLQHTLRIFLFKKGKADIPKILDKELLSIFSNSLLALEPDEEDIKEFIELLWSIRYLFDKHVIKWVDQDGSEVHLISKMIKYNKNDKFYLKRVPKLIEGEALLQSMLYHSQQITTHYWLTPYLNYLLNKDIEDSYDYLRHLDNHLLCSSEQESLIERTRKFLVNENYKPKLNIDILKEVKGTAFPHYWFYKLEFILWHKKSDIKQDKKWKEFKFTAKNSIEHIYPQTPMSKEINKLSNEESLDSFGNLALVSRSINSEYSNLPFNEKNQRFHNNNRDKLDSLKMSLIYENDIWNDVKIKQHQDEMIELFKEYFVDTERKL